MKPQKSSINREEKPPAYSPRELDAIVEEATIDSYGFDEELGSWAVYLEDELVFPFPVRVIGKAVQAIGVEERDGVVKLKVKSSDKQYWIDLLDVEIVKRAGETNRNELLILAYRRWFSPDGNIPDYEE
nr:calcium-binding protein [Candidatus Sigynarchaeum springense]MDO8118596.1 calcium-binding protein [Candidatus Sigynarchaeota archaeon]